jgi:hypothetical protein
MNTLRPKGAAVIWAAICATLTLALSLTVALAFTEPTAPAVGASPSEIDVELEEFRIEAGTLTVSSDQ